MTVRRFDHDGATLVAEEHGAGPRTHVLIHDPEVAAAAWAGLADDGRQSGVGE